MFRLIERIILQDEMNSIIQQSSHLQGIDMVNWILRFFGVKVKVQGQHLIPINGREETEQDYQIEIIPFTKTSFKFNRV